MFLRQYRKIHIEKEDVTVISVKDIHKKNYLCLLQPQRSRRLTAATVGLNSPLSAAVNTTIKPSNIISNINALNIYIYRLRKSNNYSLKSAQHKSVIILWEEDDANNFTWYLKFHASGPTIFSQVQRSLKISNVIVSLI